MADFHLNSSFWMLLLKSHWYLIWWQFRWKHYLTQRQIWHRDKKKKCDPAGSFAYCMFNQTHTMNYGRYVQATDSCILLCVKNAGGECPRHQRHQWIRTPLEYKMKLCVLSQLVFNQRETVPGVLKRKRKWNQKINIQTKNCVLLFFVCLFYFHVYTSSMFLPSLI